MDYISRQVSELSKDMDMCIADQEELYIPTDEEIDSMFNDIQSEARVKDIPLFRHLSIR